MPDRSVRAPLTAIALAFAVLGFALLFAPADAGARLLPEASGEGLWQLFGAALLGFAAMNWTARGSVLGGIYGRAIVAANQTHLTVGALLLVKRGVGEPGVQPLYWVVTGLYVAGAAYFAYLTFFSSGVGDGSSKG